MTKGYKLDQMKLFHAIMEAIAEQIPDLPAEARLMNCVIDASKTIVETFKTPMIKATTGMGLKAWFDSDDIGLSSMFMAVQLAHALDIPVPTNTRYEGENSYPRDPSDLGRCIRLVKAVPEFENQIHHMHEFGKEWTAVAFHWDEWAALYHADLGSELYTAMRLAYKD